MKQSVCTFMSALSFLISTSAVAFEGHGGGGYHSAPPSNPGYHYNGNYNNYHDNGWYGGSVNVNTWGDDDWYDNNLNDNNDEVIGVPDEGYYDPSCQTIDDCSTGTCVLVNSCDQE